MKIALLTCESISDLLPSDQPLIPEFEKHKITAVPAVWSDKSIDWKSFDYLVFRSTWDYFEREEEFNEWLDNIKDKGIKTLNSLDVINQNKHKFYLKKLKDQGILIIPTIFINKTDALNLNTVIPKHWKKVVIKPAFSGASFQTEVFEISEIEKINQIYKPIAAIKELLLQEFMPEIQTIGETSLIFFNKKYSHALIKKAADGDFRVQYQFGGKYAVAYPDDAIIEKAQNIVSLFKSKLLYARIDGIIIGNDFHLMEVECIEPDLYFQYSEGSVKRFVEAFLAIIKDFKM